MKKLRDKMETKILMAGGYNGFDIQSVMKYDKESVIGRTWFIIDKDGGIVVDHLDDATTLELLESLPIGPWQGNPKDLIVQICNEIKFLKIIGEWGPGEFRAHQRLVARFDAIIDHKAHTDEEEKERWKENLWAITEEFTR